MQITDNDIKVKSLYKSLKLLDFFTDQNPERGISELAELSGILKSSVHNIMSTFEKCGFVEKNQKTGKYRLGLKILALSNVISQTNDFKQIIKPYLDALAAKTGETVFAATPYGTNIIYIASAFPNNAISARSIQGVIAPMYCTSIGKAILAYKPEALVELVIKNGLHRFTENTITDPDEFRKEIELTRRRGYSIDNMEHEFGIKCVGTPVFDSSGEVVAAISLTGPSLRFSDEKISEYAILLNETCNEIRKRI